MDSEDSQQSSGAPESPVDAASLQQDESSHAALDDDHGQRDRSGSESRSSSDSGSDGEADPDSNPQNHATDGEEDKTQESRDAGHSKEDDEEQREENGGSHRRKNRQTNGAGEDDDLNHEDLSDVSDLDASNSADNSGQPKARNSNRSSLHSNGTVNDDGDNTASDVKEADIDDEKTNGEEEGGQKSPIVAPPVSDLRQKLNAKKKESPKKRVGIDDDLKKNDEDELDFEAEDGECADEKSETKSAKVT